jgi:aryl-alcohol dehydrogenase-like predicted oxidoreductase
MGGKCEGLKNRSSESLHITHSELANALQVSIYLLHVPDVNTPISETMEGIQALYLAEKFEHVRPRLSFTSPPLTATVWPLKLHRRASR